MEYDERVDYEKLFSKSFFIELDEALTYPSSKLLLQRLKDMQLNAMKD